MDPPPIDVPHQDDEEMHDDEEMDDDDEDEMDDDHDDDDDNDDDDDEEPMEEEQEAFPIPPSPAVSDVTCEFDTSDALGHALATEVTPTFEMGESSAAHRVTPAELRAELSRLRQDISLCQGRYMSMSRRLSTRQSEVFELKKEIKGDRRATYDLYVELYEQAARLRSSEAADAEIRERLVSLEQRMTEVEKIVERIDLGAVFTDIDSRHYQQSIQEMWDEIHAMQWQAYYDRMARFRFNDSIDVLAAYGGDRH